MASASKETTLAEAAPAAAEVVLQDWPVGGDRGGDRIIQKPASGVLSKGIILGAVMPCLISQIGNIL